MWKFGLGNKFPGNLGYLYGIKKILKTAEPISMRKVWDFSIDYKRKHPIRLPIT